MKSDMNESSKVQFGRVIRPEDFDDYLRLKSDPLAVSWSGFATEPDAKRLREHFLTLIERDVPLFMLRISGEAVGYIQLSITDDMAEVDGYSVLSQYSGRGYGSMLLSRAEEWLRLLPVAPRYMRAYVSEHNVGSLRCFARNGYVCHDDICRHVRLEALGRTDKFILVSKVIPRGVASATDKRVCVVTCARSEYGLLQGVISALEQTPHINTLTVAAGAHLEESQGMTVHEIERDGHSIAAVVPFLTDKGVTLTAGESLGRCTAAMSDVFSRLRPDLVVVLGDRYELLGICGAAILQRIPVAHISGGDVTLGAIDNQIRNALSMLATLHFPGTEASAANLRRMLGSDRNIYVVGEPGLDNVFALQPLSREALAEDLGLDVSRSWLLCTLHPETTRSDTYNAAMTRSLGEALAALTDAEVVVTAANSDPGGESINEYFKELAKECNHIHFIPSLGLRRYLSMMRQAAALVGNTSSGIVEAPAFGIPVVNLGARQQGRYASPGVITLHTPDRPAIMAALETAMQMHPAPNYYYGDGHAADLIVTQIKNYLGV